MNDFRGSAFSFQDLLADRACIYFGEFATLDQFSATTLQVRAAVRLRDPDLMPAADDLPEALAEVEFRR